MIIITGAAGFIGSCVLSYLNSLGIDDILCVDDFGNGDKWKNILNKKYIDFIGCDAFYSKLGSFHNTEIVIHMGACSSTTEDNMDFLYDNNYMCSRTLYHWCQDIDARFIYASSASTYGNGSNGFFDRADILSPSSKYGFSKYLFDQWQVTQKPLKQCVGLKFFNVYGPNEYHKDNMYSLVYNFYQEAIHKGEITIFGKDGSQSRDFIYIKDLLCIIRFFIDNADINGIFNVGTGTAVSFINLAEIVFSILGIEKKIVFQDIPDYLFPIYQLYTCADIRSLRACGYENEFYSIEEGVSDYTGYLKNNINY